MAKYIACAVGILLLGAPEARTANESAALDWLDDVREISENVKDMSQNFKDAVEPLANGLENISQAVNWGSQLADLLARLIDLLARGSRWNYEENPSQAAGVKYDVFQPMITGMETAMADLENALRQAREAMPELERLSQQLQDRLAAANQRVAEARARRNANRGDDDLEDALDEAKERQRDAMDRAAEATNAMAALRNTIHSLERALEAMRNMIREAWRDFYSCCYFVRHGARPTADQLENFLRSERPDLINRERRTRRISDARTGFRSLGEYAACLPTGGTQGRIAGGFVVEIPSGGRAVVTMRDALCIQASVPLQPGQSFDIDPESLVEFTSPRATAKDLAVKLVESPEVNGIKMVIENRGPATTLKVPAGILQTPKSGIAQFTPLTKLGGPVTDALDHLDRAAMFIEQQGASGDPVIAANPDWWTFIVPQVITQMRMNNWNEDQAKLYVAKQLEDQIPDDKKKQIPALTVEVMKRVRQADDAAETPSTVDLSTIGEFRTTKAAVEITRM